MTDHVDALVVGGGVVGLAVARALALAGRETMLVERNDAIGQEVSSRNSGVIHSGIYYPPGSLKARLCIQGRQLLYAYCAQRELPHRQCGKLIVAQATETAALGRLLANGLGNGVADLEWLDAAGASALEPQVRCEAAIWSPSTGIIDVHDFMNSLEGDLLNAGGSVALRTEFRSASAADGGLRVNLRSGDDHFDLGCSVLVNCGGLLARENANSIPEYPESLRGRTRFAKGHYFSCTGQPAFRHLVYPMPGQAGLGVHATLDLAGRVRFGPDVEWVERLEYEVDPERAGAFYGAIRSYWPGLPDGALQPDYAGIRPKLVGPGEAAADFVIEDAGTHGIRGLVNLLGIESPGLTSSLAIGEHVMALLDANA
jgi:L-2-hydroxyglutarate oxidase LhgO